MVKGNLNRESIFSAAVELINAKDGYPVKVNEVAKRVDLTEATTRRHLLALADEGALESHKDKRYEAQSRYTNFGVEGASVIRRFWTFKLPSKHQPELAASVAQVDGQDCGIHEDVLYGDDDRKTTIWAVLATVDGVTHENIFLDEEDARHFANTRARGLKRTGFNGKVELIKRVQNDTTELRLLV